jgi:hypothetical protein
MAIGTRETFMKIAELNGFAMLGVNQVPERPRPLSCC